VFEEGSVRPGDPKFRESVPNKAIGTAGRGRATGPLYFTLSSAPLRLDSLSGLRQDAGGRFALGEALEDLVHRILNARVRFVKLPRSFGRNLAQEIPILYRPYRVVNEIRTHFPCLPLLGALVFPAWQPSTSLLVQTLTAQRQQLTDCYSWLYP